MNSKKILSMLAAISVLTANSGNMIYALEEIKTGETSVEQEVTEEAKEETKEDVTEESESKIIASGDFSHHLVWSIDDKGTMTVEGNGKLMMIPSDDESLNYDVRKIVFGKGVEYLDDDMFEYYPLLEAIEVSPENPFYASADGVFFNKDMTELAFYPRCKNTESYTIPESVVTVKDRAFSGCMYIKEVHMPGNIITLGEGAFSDCGELEVVELSEGITSLPQFLFSSCSMLKTLNIPASVEKIDTEALIICSSLKEINVNPENKAYKSVDGILYNKDMTELVIYPSDKKTIEYIVPDSVVKINYRSCSGAHFSSVVIPDSVKVIEEDAFFNSDTLVTVFIGKNVETIGDSVFGYCDNISDVYYSGSEEQWGSIDKGLCIIGSDKDVNYHFDAEKTADAVALGECGKNAGDIKWSLDKDGVLTIDGKGEMLDDMQSVWEGYAELIKEVNISEGITSIGDYAFEGFTELTSVDVPESVTVIGANAFACCSSLKSVNIPAGVTELYIETFIECDVLENIEVSAENENYDSIDGVVFTEGAKSLIFYPRGKTAEKYTIPDSVEKIETSAFTKAKFSSVVIPDSVKEINDFAFEKSGLTSVDIPKGVTKISNGVFRDCEKLESVKFAGDIESIECGAFESCISLKSIDLSDSITTIAELAFYNCDSLKSVTVPKNVKKLSTMAFAGCDNLEEVVLSEGIEFIDYRAFSDCLSLKKINIPDSVNRIGEFAFSYCESLESIGISKGVKEIDPHAFSYCKSLVSFEVDAENQSYSVIDGVLFDKEGKSVIYYPPGLKNESYVIPDGVTRINELAFSDCSSLKKVEVPASVTEIGEGAFMGCYKLEDINFPEGLKRIGISAFSNCNSLKKAEMPDSVEYIGDRAFYECISLTSVKLPKNLIRIQDQTFDNCANLENAEIPEGVQEIGSSAFVSCISLENVILPDSIAKVESNAFSGCRLLQSIELPEGIKEISENTFDGCSLLKWAKIPSSVETIGRYAFYDCDSLTDIYYTGTQEQWSAIKIDVPGAILANIHFNATNTQGTDGTVGGNADIVYGDLDGNMKADLTDLSILSLYLLGDTVLDENILKGADVNGDGTVDVADLAHFKQYVSKDDVTLGA